MNDGGNGETAAQACLFLFPHLSFIRRERKDNMENRIALAGIIVEDPEAAEHVNRILHDFSEWIVGRMGIPCRSRGVNIISVVLDAPQNVLSSLSGKLGQLSGVSVKTVCSKQEKKQ